MSDLRPVVTATVLVCITCRSVADPVHEPGAEAPGAEALGALAPRAGRALAEATACSAANAPEISVQQIRCLGNCSRGLSAAIRCDNAWTYIFGGLDPARDAPSLIEGARLLAQAADGIMPWRGRPEALKRGLIARLPPSHFRGELP